MFLVIFKVRLIKFTSMGILGHFFPRFVDKNLPSRDPHPSPDNRSRLSPPRVPEGEGRVTVSDKVD